MAAGSAGSAGGMAKGAPKTRGGKDVIVKAAVRNFTDRGYHGTSMRDIARSADVTVASIYHHFGSKQDILLELMVTTMSDLISSTRSALLAAGATPAEQLDALVRAWVIFHTTRQPEALIGASELRSLDRLGLRLVVTLRDEQERMFRDVIERGVAEGAFKTPHPLDATRAVLNMGSSVSWWYRRRGPTPPEELATRYCELARGTVRGT